jgi:hypothetical protein
MALIAGAGLFHLVIGPLLSLGAGSPGAYQCSLNVYNCSDFRSRAAAQAAYQACGGRDNDVHRLDDDRDDLACEFLPSISW